FLKSFERRRLSEKRRHPKTFLSMTCFQTLSQGVLTGKRHPNPVWACPGAGQTAAPRHGG
ncbi:hypothetical protein, partial [Novacetimonas hansenii]|uniref:hypothetical protein n=1 Tax=Novacetimonas hansenii TaxID=436 RepID=UPI001A7E3D44